MSDIHEKQNGEDKLNMQLKEVIQERFSHIDFSSDEEIRTWFFEIFTPFLILKWMGGIENQSDGAGMFDTRTLDRIKLDFLTWKNSD